MGVVSVALGGVLLALVGLDVAWTTLAVGGGAGPVAGRVGRILWRAGRRRRVRGATRPLSGVGIALATLAVWVAMLWAGWTLVFTGSGAAVQAVDGVSASIAERIYFTGYVISTLGNGEFVPVGMPWQLLADLASLSGLFLATLAITYLVTVVQSASDRRQLALRVSGLGSRAGEVASALARSPGLADTLTGHVLQLAERHLAFPIIHYFHASERVAAAPPALALLDDAVLLLEHGWDDAHTADPDVVTRLRAALDRFWQTIGLHHGDAAAPPPPTVGRVSSPDDSGSAVVSETMSASEEARRRRIAGVVADDGWSWQT